MTTTLSPSSVQTVSKESNSLNKEQIISEFNEKGYLILRRFFEPKLVEGARAALQKLVEVEANKLKADGKIQDLLENEPFETRLASLFENHKDIAPHIFRKDLHQESIFPIFFNGGLLDVVELVLGRELLLYPNYTARPKFANWKKHEVLWHQDGGYTEMKGEGGAGDINSLRMVNMWTPLVTAHEEQGCMQFIPGTHKLGSVPHAKHPQWGWLEISKEYLESRVKDAVSIEMDPGDVVLFHNLLFHQGLPNRSKIIRWNLDWRYLDATQGTMRNEKGHLARSQKNPGGVVKTPAQWAGLTLS